MGKESGSEKDTPLSAPPDAGHLLVSVGIDFGYVDGRDSDAYTEDVAIRVIPILACAILVPLFFFLWSCGRCCTGCCPCCRPKESSKTVRLVLLLLIFLAAMASLGILAYGFAANDHQSETITDVPKVRAKPRVFSAKSAALLPGAGVLT